MRPLRQWRLAVYSWVDHMVSGAITRHNCSYKRLADPLYKRYEVTRLFREKKITVFFWLLIMAFHCCFILHHQMHVLFQHSFTVLFLYRSSSALHIRNRIPIFRGCSRLLCQLLSNQGRRKCQFVTIYSLIITNLMLMIILRSPLPNAKSTDYINS